MYRENYLRDNKDNLKEIEKLAYQKQEDFVPEFAKNLKRQVLNFLDHYEEKDRDAVRRALTQILKNGFDNLGENKMVDSSGKIDITVMNSQLSKGVEENLKIQSKVTIEEKSEINPTINVSNKENIDFNDPDAKKEFFQKIFTEYSSLETEEEREKYKREHFADYDEYKEEIDSSFKHKEEMARLEKEEPEMSKEERSKKASENIGETEEVTSIDDKIFENSVMITELTKQKDEIKDKGSVKFQEIKEQISRLKEENKQLKKEKDAQKTKEIDLDNSQEMKEGNVLDSILSGDVGEEKAEEELLNEISEDEATIDMEEILKSAEKQEVTTVEETQIDNVLEQAEEHKSSANELNPKGKQIEQTALVEYKPNRLKIFFMNLVDKLKESGLFKRMFGKKQNRVEVSNLAIAQVEENKKSFDESLIVSEEEQERNRAQNEKNKSKQTSISVSLGKEQRE